MTSVSSPVLIRCTLGWRGNEMKHWTRASTTLAAAAVAGFLLWYVPHFHRWTTGGYWGVMALMAAAGVLIGLSQLHNRDGSSTASFLFAFLPVLVAAGWVILASQPQGNWIRDHVLSWTGDMGIDHAVHNLGEHVAVVAFGLGAVFGLTFELKMLRRRPRNADVAPITVAAAASPLPVAAEPVVDAPELEPPSDPSSGDSPDEP